MSTQTDAAVDSSKQESKRIITGIKPTGIPHLGNYVGAIRPAIQSIQDSNDEAFFFLADYHGIIGCYDPAVIHESTKIIAATWSACRFALHRLSFYLQPPVLDIPAFLWVFSYSVAGALQTSLREFSARVHQNYKHAV